MTADVNKYVLDEKKKLDCVHWALVPSTILNYQCDITSILSMGRSSALTFTHF